MKKNEKDLGIFLFHFYNSKRIIILLYGILAGHAQLYI